jgi:hypothetical protein
MATVDSKELKLAQLLEYVLGEAGAMRRRARVDSFLPATRDKDKEMTRELLDQIIGGDGFSLETT